MWNQGCRGRSSTVVLMTGYRRKENKSEMSFGDCCRNFISEIRQADRISTQRQCCPLQEELLAWAWSPAVQSHWLEVDRSMFKRRKNPKWFFHSLLATLYPGMMRTTGWCNNPWNEHGGGSWSLRLTPSSDAWRASYHKGCAESSALVRFLNHGFSVAQSFFAGEGGP